MQICLSLMVHYNTVYLPFSYKFQTYLDSSDMIDGDKTRAAQLGGSLKGGKLPSYRADAFDSMLSCFSLLSYLLSQSVNNSQCFEMFMLLFFLNIFWNSNKNVYDRCVKRNAYVIELWYHFRKPPTIVTNCYLNSN